MNDQINNSFLLSFVLEENVALWYRLYSSKGKDSFLYFVFAVCKRLQAGASPVQNFKWGEKKNPFDLKMLWSTFKGLQQM